MEGIAKTAGQLTPITVAPISPNNGISTLNYEEIPVDVYRHFDLNMGLVESKDIDELKAISSWAFKDAETVGDAMLNIRNLEMKLGTPTGHESRINRVSNWVRLQKQIDDLKNRQESIAV